jgi:putative nucleotidyltransferase with HDIG domain
MDMSESVRQTGTSAARAGSAALDCAAGGSHDALRELRRENESLAEEVLHGYEQLNVLFEFTNQIAEVTDAEEVVNRLLGRLSRVLSAPVVCLHGADGSRRLYDSYTNRTEALGDLLGLDSTLSESAERVRTEKQSLVRTVGEFQVLLAGLPRLNDRTDVVVIVRPRSLQPFQSGDLMMVDSILSFGAHIVRNSELHERLRALSMESTRALVAAIDKKDHYTRGHSERVGMLAKLTGRELGLSAVDLQLIEWAALLHDVGKIGVPEAILQKAGKLTAAEYEIIKQHPQMGYDILQPIASLKDVLDGVLYHHENPDGSGYPHGLKGDQIPLFAHVIHVVDVFDALCSTRSYRPAFTVERALAILHQESGARLDPKAVEAFVTAFEGLRREAPEQIAEMYRAEGSA